MMRPIARKSNAWRLGAPELGSMGLWPVSSAASPGRDAHAPRAPRCRVALAVFAALAALLPGCQRPPPPDAVGAPSPPPDQFRVVATDAQDLARSLLIGLQARLRAIRQRNPAAAAAYQDRLRDALAEREIARQFESHPSKRFIVGPDLADGILRTWAAAIAYYAEGLDFATLQPIGPPASASAETPRAAFRIRARGRDDQAWIRVVTVRQPDGRWGAVELDFLAEAPAGAATPNTINCNALGPVATKAKRSASRPKSALQAPRPIAAARHAMCDARSSAARASAASAAIAGVAKASGRACSAAKPRPKPAAAIGGSAVQPASRKGARAAVAAVRPKAARPANAKAVAGATGWMKAHCPESCIAPAASNGAVAPVAARTPARWRRSGHCSSARPKKSALNSAAAGAIHTTASRGSPARIARPAQPSTQAATCSPSARSLIPPASP